MVDPMKTTAKYGGDKVIMENEAQKCHILTHVQVNRKITFEMAAIQ